MPDGAIRRSAHGYFSVDAKTNQQTGSLTDAQVDEIIRFIRTVRHINHSVQEIDAATSPPDVIIHTGSQSRSGDLVYLRKKEGHWSVTKKAKWRLIIEPSDRKGVPPVVYEKDY